MCAITEPQTERRGSVLDRPAEPRQRRRPPVNQDILAKITYTQRELFQTANTRWNDFYQNKIRFLLGTTQPGHVIAVTLVLLVASCSIPAAYSSGRASSFTTLVHLASICIHIGDQFWMTFISGLALYFNLPRHAFGEVQKVLFPKYFALNSFLSALTLITFTRLHTAHPYSFSHWLQVGNMSVCFLTELLIRVYLVPPVVSLISEKTRVELTEPGVGTEVGFHAPGRLALCPYYSKLHKSFRKLHLCVALGNIATMVCTTLQLIYLQHSYSSLQ